MPVKRVHEHQLSLGKHLKAPERQRLADELAVEIGRKQDQLRLTRLLLEAEQHREKLQELQAREAELVAKVKKLEGKWAELGGHPTFRTPVVEGYGLANAIRKEEE